MAEMQKQGGMPKKSSLGDDINALLGAAGVNEQGAPGEKPPEDEAPMGEDGGDEAMVIADLLDVSPEKAAQLLEAARSMPKLADKSADEIGQMLASDMNLRMQVEKNIGASEDGMAREKMVKDQMGPKEPPVPMEPTPAGALKK